MGSLGSPPVLPGVGANLPLALHRAVSAARDDSGVCLSGCRDAARTQRVTCACPRGWPGSPAPGSSGRDGGSRGRSYLIFKKGISYFCMFL